jgi:hypothetical protein
MPIKKNFENNEDAIKYIEELRQKNRERARNYYNNVIKTDPEKHRKYIEKCKEPKIKIKTEEEIEISKQKKRENSKKYYDNTLKNDPEKYKKFLERCIKNNNVYYHKHKNETVEI